MLIFTPFLFVLLESTDRYSLVDIETTSSRPLATIRHLGNDLKCLGELSSGQLGDPHAAVWEESLLAAEIGQWNESSAACPEGGQYFWGEASGGWTSTVIFKSNVNGKIFQQWSISTQPAFTSVVGAVDGYGVVRNSEGSGSSTWHGRVCNPDGSVVLIPVANGESLFCNDVGKLSDGRPVVIGSIYVSNSSYPFLYYLETNEIVDLRSYVDIGTEGSSSAKIIGEDGRVHFIHRNNLYEWFYGWVDPVTGKKETFYPIPHWGIEVNSNGSFAGVSAAGGIDQVYRKILNQPLEGVSIDGFFLTGATVSSSGAVLIGVLSDTTYQSSVFVWPSDSSYPVPLQSRAIGSLGEVFGYGVTSSNGDAVIHASTGAKLLRKIHHADVNGDTQINVLDILEMLSHWGNYSGPCGPDINYDGYVNTFDLLEVISSI